MNMTKAFKRAVFPIVIASLAGCSTASLQSLTDTIPNPLGDVSKERLAETMGAPVCATATLPDGTPLAWIGDVPMGSIHGAVILPPEISNLQPNMGLTVTKITREDARKQGIAIQPTGHPECQGSAWQRLRVIQGDPWQPGWLPYHPGQQPEFPPRQPSAPAYPPSVAPQNYIYNPQ